MKKRRTTLRLLSALCALILCLGVLPAMQIASTAATIEKNVASGKSGRTGTSSNVPGLTDGNVGTIAADINWNANIASSSCWAEVDLGQAYDLTAVKLVQYYSDTRYYHWEAYASNNNTLAIGSWTKIAEKNDSTYSTVSGYTAPVTTSISARYVRIYGTYNNLNVGFHFNEIEVFASVPFEPQTWTAGGVTFTLDADATMTVTGTGNMPNYAQAGSRPWAEFASIIQNVVIGEGVTSIGQNVFAGCGTIESLTLPVSVTSLRANAFLNTKVENISYNGVSSAFNNGLTVKGSGNDGFWRANWINDPDGDRTGWLNESIFWEFNNGKLTVSGTGAMPGMSVQERPYQKFASSITEVRVSNGITELGATVFSTIPGLNSVYIPDSVTVLRNDAFSGCGSIDYMRLSCNITAVYQGVLYLTPVTTIACAIDYAAFRANLTTFGAYNDNFAAAQWVQEDDPNILFNLSKGILPEVTAGSGAKYITDGNKGNGTYWDGGVGPAEATIDLGGGAFISSINVTTYHGDGRYYHYEIYASIDGRDYTLVGEKSDNTAASGSGEDYYFDTPLYARYVLVNVTKNSANASVHLCEVTVMGKFDPDYVEPEPPTSDEIDPLNVAYGKPARSAISTEKAARVTDGSNGTVFTAEYYPTYVDIDLLEEYDISEIIVYFPVRGTKYYYYTVYGSNDLSNFDRLCQKRTDAPATASGDVIAPNATYRFIRVYIEYVSGAGSASLAEVRVHGTPTGGNTGALRTGRIDEILGIEDFDDTEFAAPITTDETIENVYGIIDRTVGAQYRSWFSFEIAPNAQNGNDYYEISMKNGKVHITANTGVCLAAGLNYYYKYFCCVEISEQARQTKMPDGIVPVNTAIRRETPYKIRYAFNYCTLDYSFAFYGEEDFIKENDWLALCGVNVVLDLAGQEAVWIKFLQNFGYSFDEAKDWIAGPAYYAWQFMDNMENFGGPVHDGWVYDRLMMARRTQRFKRSLGIDTVLQGYAGMIPTNFSDYQDVPILKQGMWSGLARPDMIRTDGDLYDEYAELFYEAQRWALGETSDYYAVDPFHEGGIRPSDLSDSTIAAEVLESLLSYDPDAVWMVQAWWSNPTNGLLQGMGSNRQDHVIILDLTADKWNTTTYGGTTLDSIEFDGTDWVWCLLKNYGGNTSMDGRLNDLATKIPQAYASAEHMKGIGLISEATLDNPVVYQLLFDMAWYTETVDLDAWLDDYAVRRYGAVSENARAAWDILKDTVYSRQGESTQIITRLPDNIGYAYPSNTQLRLESALRLLFADFDLLKDSEAYMYDLTELMRQIVSNYACTAHNKVWDAFRAEDLDAFLEAKEEFLAVFDILNDVLGTEKDLMAGTWIGRALDWAEQYDDFSFDCLPMSAKALITTWACASTAGAIPDYAHRQYEGMVIDVYKARWSNYLDKQEEYLRNGTEIEKMGYGDYFHVYWNWIMNTPEYDRTPDNSPDHMHALTARVLNECTVDQQLPENVGNIAKDKRVTASAEEASGDPNGGPAAGAVDGSLETYWDGGRCDNAPTLTVDLGAVYDLTKINVVTYYDSDRYYHYDIYISVDGVNFTQAIVKDGNDPATSAGDVFEQPFTARYVRIVGRYDSANPSFHLKELRAYGTLTNLLTGDLNRDGEVNVQDVSLLLDVLAGVETDPGNADITNDGELTVHDVTALLNIIAYQHA